MNTPTTIDRESSIIERLVIDPEGARSLLSLEFDADDKDRMRELMEKNNRGTLTPAEAEEMESFRRIGNFLGILQARARVCLKNVSQSDQ